MRSHSDTLTELLAVLDAMKEAHATQPIIVEGAKDIAALRALEFDGILIKINTGQSLADFSDMVAKQAGHVILLTDWDRAGTKLAGRVTDALLANGVVVDHTYRAALKKYCKKEIKDVECLDTFIANLRARISQQSAAPS